MNGRLQLCWVDRYSCVVMHGRRAAHLGFMQFAIFDALHQQGKRKGKKLSGDALADIVYAGARNPSTKGTLHVCIHNMNKKLMHIGLKIQGVNRKQNSYYQIVVL